MAVAIACAVVSATASERFEFADPERAAALLGSRDAFIEAMTPFDRSIRMETSASSGEAEYLDFLKRQVRSWDADEIAQLERSLQEIERQLSRLVKPLPKPIVLIRASDRVEAGAPHTRGSGIVLSDASLRMSPEQLRFVLFHELFHLLTRFDSGLRDELYGLIGFLPCGHRLELSEELASRLVTNPDAPRSLHFIRVSIMGRQRSVVPLLIAKRGGDRPKLFDAFELRFVEVQARGGACTPVGLESRLYELSELDGFFSQVGTNTKYVIHPEEVLADNFALWMTGAENLPDPELVERLRQELSR